MKFFMKTYFVAMIMVTALIAGCTKKPVSVTSIDQLQGKWKWESTCGASILGCTFSSKSQYATIEFTSDSKYIETHNDTIYLQSKYSVSKYDETFGTLILENPIHSLSIAIVDNKLLITRGELIESYYKIK
jgi:hypothetical protein